MAISEYEGNLAIVATYKIKLILPFWWMVLLYVLEIIIKSANRYVKE